MRGVRALALLLVVAGACANAGCGNGGGSGRRAGSEPVASSEPSRPAPASGGSPQPMFAGPPRGERDRVGALAGTPLMEAERRREEAAERALGPERLAEDRQARGRALADQMAAAAAAAASDDGDECEQAWAAQDALREEMPASGRASEEDFLRTCRAMPERERRCMSPVYFRAHLQECTQSQADTMARMRREGRLAAAEGRGQRTIEVDVAGGSPPAASPTASPGPSPSPGAPSPGPRRVPMPQ